jgi:NADPH2:quinone reductase
LAEAGEIVPHVDPRHFSLASVDEAYRAIESRGAAGKIVIDIPD